jgi:lysophospholipase L1-like esterase
LPDAASSFRDVTTLKANAAVKRIHRRKSVVRHLSQPPTQNHRLKTSLFFIAILFAFALSRVPAADPATHPPVRLVIVGDSTVCNYPESSIKRGWGMFVQGCFNSNQVQVINLAASGRSAKTFIKEGRWAAALKEKPDYVLIQFGHNDSHSPDRPEATDARTTYRQYLRQYIDESRAIGAKPVLITPMCRRNFNADGQVVNAMLPYANAMKAVAQEERVPLVDLNAASVELCNELGPKASETLADSSTDHTHFNAKGAREMARLVMQELPVVEPSLKQFEKNIETR